MRTKCNLGYAITLIAVGLIAGCSDDGGDAAVSAGPEPKENTEAYFLKYPDKAAEVVAACDGGSRSYSIVECYAAGAGLNAARESKRSELAKALSEKSFETLLPAKREACVFSKDSNTYAGNCSAYEDALQFKREAIIHRLGNNAPEILQGMKDKLCAGLYDKDSAARNAFRELNKQEATECALFDQAMQWSLNRPIREAAARVAGLSDEEMAADMAKHCDGWEFGYSRGSRSFFFRQSSGTMGDCSPYAPEIFRRAKAYQGEFEKDSVLARDMDARCDRMEQEAHSGRGNLKFSPWFTDYRQIECAAAEAAAH